MNNNLASMWIMLFVISFVFNLGLKVYDQPQATQPEEITSVELDEPNAAYGFLGPLMIVWNFVKDMVKFINAPWIFLSSAGAPQEIMTLIAVPWSVAWIFSLVSFVRGFRA